ncbi:pseudouridine synthase [Paenibacillus daejeonensis]|uniref:pseudouridine synthase n=1 Tax=Paenibacillus daejeonensis TaxID=135193 RepID=UPI000373062C|nr:pseudouridine synthase [Paenibacillus daejeonensis]
MAKPIRLDKLLSHMGYGSRSEIKKAVKQGKVTVNDRLVKDSGLNVDPENDEVYWQDTRVMYRDVIYFMMHKPQGVISATEDTRERTVIDLLQPEDRLLKPFPVGRLDKDTEGLLLLTNDGQLAHELLSPRKHVDKTYEAIVAGKVSEEDRDLFERGVQLDDGYVTMPAVLHIDHVEEQSDGSFTSRITLTIREGKFHQVKRMFEAVGKRVTYLRRITMGTLELDPGLPLGRYRELTEQELVSLQDHAASVKAKKTQT